MKIGINLLQYRDVQGIEIYAYNVIAKVLELDKENDYYLFVNEKSDKIFNFVLGGNIYKKIIKVDCNSRLKLILAQQFILPFLLMKNKIDILFCPSIAMPLLWRKKIVTIYDLAFMRYEEEVAGLFSRIYLKLACLSAKYFSKKIITVSSFSKEEICKLLNITERHIAITYGALNKQEINEENINSLKKFNLINPNNSIKPYLIYIGNSRPRKNLSRMIEAFSIFVKENLDYKFVIVGKKDKKYVDLDELIKIYGLENLVIQTGFVNEEEKNNLLSNSKAICFCSLYEGFGLPILEAQSLGVPVLTSNSSSLPEVSDDGALFVNPESVDDIARGMKEIIGNIELRKKLIVIGKKNVLRFSWDDSAKILLEELTK